MHHPRLLLVHPDGLCQRLEPSQKIRHMPQQGRRRQAHPELGPLPLEGPRRVPLPIHLHQERHPHAQAIARAAEQRRLQWREHFRHRLPRPSRALACGPVAWPPDPPHVRLDLDLDPVADRLAVAAVGPPAVQTLALDRLRLVPLLPHRQAGPRDPRMRAGSQLSPARPLRPLTGARTARPRPAGAAALTLLTPLPERRLQQLLLALPQARILLLQLPHPPGQLRDLPPRIRQLPLRCPPLPHTLRHTRLRPRVHAPPGMRRLLRLDQRHRLGRHPLPPPVEARGPHQPSLRFRLPAQLHIR